MGRPIAIRYRRSDQVLIYIRTGYGFYTDLRFVYIIFAHIPA